MQYFMLLPLSNSRKPILFISLAGFIVTNLLLACVNVAPPFVLIRFVEGMLLSGLMPVTMSMVGDTIPLEKQGRWIGFLTTAQAVGFAWVSKLVLG